jgi:hypothetical protein
VQALGGQPQRAPDGVPHIDGFSLHVAMRCGADDRQALEQLCRYITRPVLTNERVQTKVAGQAASR